MKVDFDGIQAFVTIAETGGFTAASEYLHVTQTALTRRIQKLESYLDLRLLDRTTRHVELTSVGREFLPQAKSIVEEVTKALDHLKDVSKHGVGHFTIACIPTMASYKLPEAIKRYSLTHPDNHIRVIDTNAFDVRDAVLHGKAELGIGISTEQHAELEETPLLEEPYMFFCPAGHPLSNRTGVTWSDLNDAHLITISTLSANRVLMDYQLAKHGIKLSGTYEVRHLSTAIGLVSAGVGVAILPESTLEPRTRSGICRILLSGPTIRRQIVMFRRRHSTLSPAASAFYELLVRDPGQARA